MDEETLDQLLRDAEPTYRQAPPAPLDAMWARIEREAFPTAEVVPITRARRAVPARWMGVGGAIAAALLVGVFIGRRSAPTAAVAPQAALPVPSAALPVSAPSTDPYQRATDDLLGRTAVLLAALPQDQTVAGGEARLAQQGAQLLATTRLLLDSPVSDDARMRPLLEDLELVLVQVARLRAPHQRDDLHLIHDALNERDIVPRLRAAAVRTLPQSN